MPIKECTLPEGGKGWKWGDAGKCYRDRADAEKQAAAAHANWFTGDSAIAFDYASVRRFDEDGRLHVALTNISKANVCPYLGKEIPGAEQLGLDPERIYQLYRDPKELEKAAPTFNNIPLLSEHVPVSVTDHQPDLVMVSTGTDAVFEAPYLKNSLVVWVADAINGIERNEQRELSCAYRYEADMTPGVVDGTPYDGVMRNIRGNHVALVATGRAGPDVIVGDSTLEVSPMSLKKPLSRKAMLVKGALTAYLRPKLATDAKIDLNKILVDVASDNWKKNRPNVVTALKAAAAGKLAADANLDDVVELLDALEGDPGMTGDDPADPNMTGDAEGLTEEEEAQYQALAKRRKPDGAKDEPSEEEKAKAEKDKKEKEEKEKSAMDAALKATEQKTVERMNAIREAERIVRPHIGDLVTAMDSAEAVYKLALDHAKVDLTNVPPSAYAAMVKMLPIPGAPKAPVAMDSGVQAEVAAFYKQV
jgi:hypothetical protein